MEEVFKGLIPESLREYNDLSLGDLVFILLMFGVVFIVTVALLVLVLTILLKLNKKIFERLENKHGKRLQFQFMEKAISTILVMLIIVIPLAGDKISQSLLGSTAVIAAVVGIAAQDVLKDMFAGLQISMYKPFDIGDRIELEDGTVGVVESMTMRHVVLIRIDTLKIVIPNSKINHVSMVNYSFGDIPRGILFKFPVSYDSDIEKAREVIAHAVKSSPYSVEGMKDSAGDPDYAPVYFLDLTDSAVIMSVTVYCKSGQRTEVVKDDIHTRVFKALKENDIEIPYNYMNIVMHSEK